MPRADWPPVVDGIVLPRDPFAPDASPVSADIPMVLGNTHDETSVPVRGYAHLGRCARRSAQRGRHLSRSLLR